MKLVLLSHCHMYIQDVLTAYNILQLISQPSRSIERLKHSLDLLNVGQKKLYSIFIRKCVCYFQKIKNNILKLGSIFTRCNIFGFEITGLNQGTLQPKIFETMFDLHLYFHLLL